MRVRSLCVGALFALSHLHAAVFESAAGHYRIQYDEKVWEPAAHPIKDISDQEWLLRGQEGYAFAIFEQAHVSLTELKLAVLNNMRVHDKDASITRQQEVEVQGRGVLQLEIEATHNGIPFTYVGRFYSGPTGTLQLIAFTTTNFTHQYRDVFQELLNGLDFAEEVQPTD